MVSIRRRTALFALSLVLPLAATACGGGTHTVTTTTTTTTAAAAPVVPHLLGKQAYIREMRVLGTRIGTAFNTIYPIDTGLHGSGTAKQTATRLKRVEAVFQGALTTLRGITPPARVAADYRRLETGIAGVAAELAQVIKALETDNFEALVVPSRLTDLSIIDAATTSMEKKGFDVLGNTAGGP